MSTEQTTDQTQSGQGVIGFCGLRPLFPEEVLAQVAAGARLVRFEYCFSLILFTIRRQSPIYLTESWQGRYLRGLGYSVLTILLGPWGVPWGLIFTPWAIWVNITGGVDETDAMLAQLTDHTPCCPNSPPATGNAGGWMPSSAPEAGGMKR